MRIQQDRAQKEVKDTNHNADSAGSDVNPLVVTKLENAIVFTLTTRAVILSCLVPECIEA
jgi:hypothetical protein